MLKAAVALGWLPGEAPGGESPAKKRKKRPGGGDSVIVNGRRRGSCAIARAKIQTRQSKQAQQSAESIPCRSRPKSKMVN